MTKSAGKDLRTPLSRARGLGSAKSGVEHFIHQRATAVFLAVLLPWFTISMLLATDGTYESVRAYLAHPFNAIGVLLLSITMLIHMRLGLQTVIEDYLHAAVGRTAAMLANIIIPAVLALVAVLSVLKVYVGA
jgi:succinate dehydrogenase / fumarate reductase, membrane anchor subunit